MKTSGLRSGALDEGLLVRLFVFAGLAPESFHSVFADLLSDASTPPVHHSIGRKEAQEDETEEQSTEASCDHPAASVRILDDDGT